MRLKYIDAVSFQCSELTNFRALARRNKWSLKAGEVACLVSLTGDQMLFVYAPTEHEVAGQGLEVLRSERVRLTGKQRWSPSMLGDYAKSIGLPLEGIKLFEEAYKDLWTQGGGKADGRRRK